jgi:hypothetical protein
MFSEVYLFTLCIAGRPGVAGVGGVRRTVRLTCFAALEASSSTFSSSSSILLQFSDADHINIPLLQDGLDKHYDLPNGTLGLGWTDCSPPFGGEEGP